MMFFDVVILGTAAILLLFFVLFLSTRKDNKTLLLVKQVWIKFGSYLGTVINPIILGLIYYFIITPIALFCRILGRDELLIKQKNNPSFWCEKETKTVSTDSMFLQF